MATSCQIIYGDENGHRAVTLESDLLRVTVLPEKGADIYALVYKPDDVDFLWKNPIGLAPPGAPPQEGSDGLAFLENYEGAWQELFPNAGDPTTYKGQEIPFHGEVATLPWRMEVVQETQDEVAVRFSVETRQTPFRLARTMRLRRGQASMQLEETVTNLGEQEAHFTWGHHCVLGAPFLEAGCVLQVPAQTLLTPDVLYEETARLAPGQREAWPLARGRDGSRVDMRHVPGPEEESHDDVYLTDLSAGWVAVTNPRRDLTFSLSWDPAVFQWVVNWQVYGGAKAPPFNGLAYAVGIEPWTSNLPLGDAVAAGQAQTLPPGAQFETTLEARIISGTFEGGSV